MNTIAILGGGLSGLIAAINLKYAGIDTGVHERKRSCGKPNREFQFFENWTLFSRHSTESSGRCRS